MDAAKRTILAGLFLAALPTPGWAGNNIGLYFQQRENAPEILAIRVDKVWQDFALGASGCPMAAVTLDARVTGVTRSASHLKPGDAVTIRYYRRPPCRLSLSACGPVATPVPRQGSECAAYLSPRRGGGYAPFADGYDAFLSGLNRRLAQEPSPFWWPIAEHPILTAFLTLTVVAAGVRYACSRKGVESASSLDAS